MFIDVYAIQTVPPSNINRDDTGAPKTALYGGVRRARVSSQAWKRAMREDFRQYLPEGSLGVRTKLAAELIAQRIEAKRPDLVGIASELASTVLSVLGIKVKASKRAGDDEGKSETGYLVFIAEHELDALSNIAIKWVDAGAKWKKPDKAMKDEVKAAFHGTSAVDIALFGRMLADVPELNTDASAQVAHAISVDRVTQEYDYFTAVDDCASEDNVGAGMIGTVDFNSSTLYRYATLNVTALYDQLGDVDATVQGTSAFVRAFVCSMPTGKQNTFANRTLPSCVLVSAREQQPINVVSAFEQPVLPREDKTIARQAADRLGQRVAEVEAAYDMQSSGAWYLSAEDSVASLDKVGRQTDLRGLLNSVQDVVRDSLLGE